MTESKSLHLEVAEVMSEVAAALQSPMDLDETLELITRSAADTIPGIIEASISITTKDREIKTLAPTGLLVTRADHLQYELGEGPCLDAALDDPIVAVNDLAADPRWPDFGPKAAALGFGSQVAFQFRAEPHVRGALNLYALEPNSIDQDSVQLGSMFAGQIAVAMGWARQDQTMTEALATRNVIGQAVGIVMERYQVDSDRAFAFLVRLSQSRNTKLRTVATALVDQSNANSQR
ncbi:GAF domain-containing protein [Kribbella orskensis]|uniref:GAF domain-containing protein n=1 Tax=Kribbella orskensis TaxID=2512216 RepID=A0ABY2BLX4_9ACTN|nr:MULTISPECIES: GAF and ANTAR domain-containing protein [Kribbella]TCN41135.1 GAF domain-containing protein [Kribbella sp. VKM Ac-2500]TCO24387.1 GAF domain-containing protein [Kribbella orskensis]